MSKFEPYDLYANNKDFLVSDSVITFTDTDGTLLALKPDVTLSIVKNYQHAPGHIQKTHYCENVYRTTSSEQGFREIMQMGLECIGDVDMYTVCEVLQLAVRSLSEMSDDYVLAISHMGILEEILSACSLDDKERSLVLKCLEEKNIDALCSLAIPLPEKTLQQLKTLLHVYAPLCVGLENGQCLSDLTAYRELTELSQLLDSMGISEKVYLDFSIVGAGNYYNGLIFRGYVADIPFSVVSGGQYDSLVHKMGKPAKGIGFAVYLNRLELLYHTADSYDCDIALVYGNEKPEAVLSAAKELRSKYEQVLIVREAAPNLRCRKLLRLKDGKVEDYA